MRDWPMPSSISAWNDSSKSSQRSISSGVVTCSNPEEAGRPDLAQPAWVPFFEACQELALPINFHIGSSAGAMDFYGKAPWPSLPNEARLALGSSNLFLGNARVIGNLIYSGVAERFPGCRFVSVESGIGWLPFYLDALTWEMGETMPNASARLRLTPWSCKILWMRVWMARP